MDITKQILLFIKRKKGEEGPEDAAALEQIAQSKEAKQQLAEFDRTWDAVTSYKESYQPDVDTGWERFAEKMKAAQREEAKVVTLSSRLRLWSAVAAGLLVLVVAWFMLPTSNPTVYVQTSGEEQTSVTLPDGSIIFLNANSSLSYPTDFDRKERLVEFSGEAFFNIAKRTNQPFIIGTSGTSITVLGTSFNVRAFDQENFTEVQVKTGLVSVKDLNTEASSEIRAGKKLHCTKTGDMRIEPVKIEEIDAWIKPNLVFKDTPVLTILEALEDNFSITFDTKQLAVADCLYNCDFEDVKLKDVITNLEKGLKLKISKTSERSYVCSGGVCED